jgi:hypothetical protein
MDGAAYRKIGPIAFILTVGEEIEGDEGYRFAGAVLMDKGYLGGFAVGFVAVHENDAGASCGISGYQLVIR